MRPRPFFDIFERLPYAVQTLCCYALGYWSGALYEHNGHPLVGLLLKSLALVSVITFTRRELRSIEACQRELAALSAETEAEVRRLAS